MVRDMRTTLILTVFLLIFLIASPSSVISEEAIKDENIFIQKFIEAGKVKDQVRMKEVVKQGEAIVYKVVMLFAYEGIKKMAEGKDGVNYFRTAEIMAKVYAEEFRKEGLLDLVRVYRQYTQEMCKERLKGDGLIDEGFGLYDKSKWREAQSRWAEALKIYQKLGDAAGELRCLNNIGTIYDSLGQYKEALEYYRQSLEINRRVGDVTGESSCLMNIGVVQGRLGQYKEALGYLKQSLEINRRIGDAAGESKCLTNIGNVYKSLGQYKEALIYYGQSLEINRRIGDVKGESASLMGIGNVYSRLGQYKEGLECHRRSLEISRRIRDVTGESSCLANIGNVYDSLGQYKEALDYLKQSLEIKRRIGDVTGESTCLTNTGIIHYMLGQYKEALDYLKQSLEIKRRIGDVTGESSCLMNIGNVYYSLGQHKEALDYLKQSLEIKRRIGDVKGEAGCLANIGNVYYRLGQYKEALDYLKQSLEINRRIGDVKCESGSLMGIGNVYNSLGQYKEVLENYRQSLEINRRIGDVRGESACLNNTGNVYGSLGQYDKAIELFQETVKISERIGVLEAVWTGYMGLGKSLWKSGKGEEAVAHYKKAVEVIEELYQFTKGLKEEERSSMIGEKSFVYREFIGLLLELHRKNPNKGYGKEAFIISEKSKSRTFQEMIAKAGAKIAFSGESKDETFRKMIEREQQLVIEITNQRTLLTKELSKPERERNQEVIDSLKSQLAKSEKTLADLEKEIESKYPRYADLKKPKSLTVEELQEILKPDETVVSYVGGKDKVAVFVIGKKSFKLIEIGTSKEELSKLIRRFRRGLEDIREVKDLEKFKPEVAYELYQKIFSPLSSELRGITKLYISGDDILYTLPFEALVDKKIDEKAFNEARERGGVYLSEYGTLHYLIDTYTITYLPSVSVLRSLRKYEKPGYGKWSKPLVAFADPIFSEEEIKKEVKDKVKDKGLKPKGINPETQLTVQIMTRSTGSEKLGRLKESAQEAEAISKELKSKKEDIYLREKATEENVYKADLKNARYLLFSTHGLLGGDFSGVAEPALALTLIDNPPGRDGFLTMSEVLGLDLNSELIILSACNTSGRGDKTGSGEGFVGLTRSFMYAGGKSLLVTHWSVESEAARDLMVNTMRLMRGKTKPDALREAKLSMKKSIMQKGNEKLSLSHPFFWAPFVLVGEAI
jgi:tetratricopeptide (TPR) repeat protein